MINNWAYKVAGIKEQKYENSRFVIWRFLSSSVFDVCDAYRAVTRWLLSKIQGEIIVCMDWTDVCKFKVLAITLTVRSLGRTLPLYVKAIRKEDAEKEMTRMETELLKLFFEGLDPETRSRVIVLADRGFAKIELKKFIQSYNAGFITRQPKTSYVFIDDRCIDLKSIAIDTYEGKQYRNVLLTQQHKYLVNLVVRKVRPERINHDDDPDWILATNIDLQPNEICRRYSHRMKIEEMFLDLKSAGFNVEDTLCQDENTMNKIILVLCLAYVFVVSWKTLVPPIVIDMVTTEKKRRRNTVEHSEFQISMRVFELITDRSGWTREEQQFVWTYLLIRTKTRKRLLTIYL